MRNQQRNESNERNYKRPTTNEDTDRVNRSRRKLRQTPSILKTSTSDINPTKRSVSMRDFDDASLQALPGSRAIQRSPVDRSLTEPDDTSKNEEFVKRVGSKASRSSSLRPTVVVPTNADSASDRKHISTGSLIQIARNKTQSKMTSTHHNVLSRIADISSSSTSETDTESNSEANYVLKSSSRPTSETKRNIDSVSANVIDKDYDAACDTLSTLGIVSNRNKLNNTWDLASETRNISSLTKGKKRVSVSSPPPLREDPDEDPQYDSISGAPLLSIGSPSFSRFSTNPESSKNILSVSKYKMDNVFEEGPLANVEANLSNLGLVSDKCALHSTSHMTTDKYRTSSAQDKVLQSDSCECWKVCTCKPRSDFPIIRHERMPFEQNPAITCIIANNGLVPKRYTASYTFSYDNLNGNQVSDSKN